MVVVKTNPRLNRAAGERIAAPLVPGWKEGWRLRWCDACTGFVAHDEQMACVICGTVKVDPGGDR